MSRVTVHSKSTTLGVGPVAPPPMKTTGTLGVALTSSGHAAEPSSFTARSR